MIIKCIDREFNFLKKERSYCIHIRLQVSIIYIYLREFLHLIKFQFLAGTRFNILIGGFDREREREPAVGFGFCLDSIIRKWKIPLNPISNLMHSASESNKSIIVYVFVCVAIADWISSHNRIWVIYYMYVKYVAKSEIKSLFSLIPSFYFPVCLATSPYIHYTHFERTKFSLWFLRQSMCYMVWDLSWLYKVYVCVWFEHEGHICKVLQILASFYVGGATVFCYCCYYYCCAENSWLLNFHLAVKIMEFNLFFCSPNT